MKKSVLLILVTVVAAAGLYSQTFTYVGSAKCAI